MKKAYKNIGWAILVAIGIASAIYCYENVALPFYLGALMFLANCVAVAVIYHYFISVEEDDLEN